MHERRRVILVGGLILSLSLGSGCGDDAASGNNHPGNNNTAQGVCGDGVLDPGEECDDGAANSDVLPDACRTTCRWAYCGDGLIDTDEVCDTDDVSGATCVSEGFTKGILVCGSDCQLDVTGCSTCGDGVAEGSSTSEVMYESCDGTDLRGHTCISVGQANGILACRPDCTWDFDLCLGGNVCLTDADCAGGQQICDDHVCRACALGECGEGRVCANDFCVTGDCFIGSLVRQQGDVDPTDPCNACDRDVAQGAWSPNPGAPCDDGEACTHDDACSADVAGLCAGTAYTCPSQACSVGVCHGTGVADCTEEIAPTHTGCFLDGACFADDDLNPANPCQACDGPNNEWVDLATGTRCGACQVCGIWDGEMTCLDVPGGQDPHDDCTDNCQACDGFGGCGWAGTGSDPNDDCLSSPISTCGLTGDCAGGSGTCAYHTGGLGQVDDGNPCTVNDVCNGAGAATGTPVLDNTRCNTTKVCLSGVCSDCTSSTQCGVGAVCANGSCVTGNCVNAGDCGAAALCHHWACTNNQCIDTPDTGGTGCWPPADGNLCATATTCSSGSCVGSSYRDCTNHDAFSCTTGTCQTTTGNCVLAYVNPGTCLIDSVCRLGGDDNPGNECQECVPTTSQTVWTAKADGTECSVATPCADLCSSGSCVDRFSTRMVVVGGLGQPLLWDRLYNRVYYIPSYSCPPATMGYNTAVDTCAAVGTGWQLASVAALTALDDGGTTCTDQSCDAQTIAVDPIAGGMLDQGQEYWARWSGVGATRTSVRFESTGAVSTVQNVWQTKSFAIICTLSL